MITLLCLLIVVLFIKLMFKILPAIIGFSFTFLLLLQIIGFILLVPFIGILFVFLDVVVVFIIVGLIKTIVY